MTFNHYLLAGLLCLGAAPAALGCGFHPAMEVQLESMYLGSLSVAVALRGAADSGVIDAAALEAPGKRAALYSDSVRRLQETAGELLSGLCGEPPVGTLLTVVR
jgi:hypothetical protein